MDEPRTTNFTLESRRHLAQRSVPETLTDFISLFKEWCAFVLLTILVSAMTASGCQQWVREREWIRVKCIYCRWPIDFNQFCYCNCSPITCVTMRLHKYGAVCEVLVENRAQQISCHFILYWLQITSTSVQQLLKANPSPLNCWTHDQQ